MVQTPENAKYMLLDQVQLGQFKELAMKLTKQASNRTWDKKEYNPKVGESQPGYNELEDLEPPATPMPNDDDKQDEEMSEQPEEATQPQNVNK